MSSQDMRAATWIVIGVVAVALPACWYFLRTVIAQNKSLANPMPGSATGYGKVTASVARNEGRRNKAAESASALEAISKLAALADKGMLSPADFQKKKDELLSHV